MEFFEFIFVFSVAFVLPLMIIKMSLDYKTARAKARAGTGEAAGVTAGELRQLLNEAVEDANAPLLARIDDLERAVLGTQADRLELDDVYGDEAGEQERTLGRRVAE